MSSQLSEVTPVIVKAPFSGGQRKTGASKGPSELLSDARLLTFLSDRQILVEGFEDVYVESLEEAYPRRVEGGVHNFELVSTFNKDLHQLIRKLARQHKVVTLGGDHSIAIGSISALCAVHPGLKVIWIDAHADINTINNTVSGNLHGTPVSFLMGLGDSRMSWLKPCLNPADIVYVGLRDVEPQETKTMEENRIKAFYMHDVARLGIEEVIRQILDFVGESPVHVSLDVDGLDPNFTGATGTPVPDGLTFDDVKELFQALETKNTVSMDVVEVNPEEGTKQDRANTIDYTNRLIAAFLTP